MERRYTRIQFFQALCGDCIGISFQGKGKVNRHIVIDAGYPGTYRRTLRPFAKGIKEAGEKIDLFVITHTDNDHIGGIKNFLREFGDSGLVNRFWFNWSHHLFPLRDDDDRISIRQGIDLRDKLSGLGLLEPSPITNAVQYSIDEANLTVLSPNHEKFEQFWKNWGKKERKIIEREAETKISKTANDYHLYVQELAEKTFQEDTAIENGSSIAFLFESPAARGLFLADAHPSVIVESLRGLGYHEGHRLKVDFVKLSHHGSKGNTSPELIRLVDCFNFVISSNGNNQHNLPDKEPLARISEHYTRNFPEESVNFLFNYEHPALKAIFSQEEMKRYSINLQFPVMGERAVTLEFK